MCNMSSSASGGTNFDFSKPPPGYQVQAAKALKNYGTTSTAVSQYAPVHKSIASKNYGTTANPYSTTTANYYAPVSKSVATTTSYYPAVTNPQAMADRLRMAERRARNLRLIRTRIHLRRDYDPFDLPEQRFIELFRLSKGLARHLIELLTPRLQDRISRKGVSLETRVLTALRFYAVGSYQRCVGQEFNTGLSQTTVHRCIKSVTIALADLANDFILMPLTEQERNAEKLQFMNKWGFPGVIGAIDGTHISILKPHIDEQNYINRKGYHSINVQLISDHRMKIRALHANYGGATHDSFIWRNSQVKLLIEKINIRESCWLVGDSGYPLEPVLLTPFRNPMNGRQQNYNNALSRARNVVERCFGLLNIRFRVLLKETASRYDPAFMCNIVKACSVLHNMCIKANIDFNVEGVPDENNNNFFPAPAVGRIQVRERVVNNYFQ